MRPVFRKEKPPVPRRKITQKNLAAGEILKESFKIRRLVGQALQSLKLLEPDVPDAVRILEKVVGGGR